MNLYKSHRPEGPVALLFALMSALVRQLGDVRRSPDGVLRSPAPFAVLLIYALRGD